MYKHFFKRFFDFWIALVVLICLSPVLIVVTIWLYFANKGAGAFFLQERPGKDGKIFKVKDMMPGENAPPMHPNDHCSTAAHYASRAEFDAWLDAKAAGETALGFEEWKKRK